MPVICYSHFSTISKWIVWGVFVLHSRESSVPGYTAFEASLRSFSSFIPLQHCMTHNTEYTQGIHMRINRQCFNCSFFFLDKPSGKKTTCYCRHLVVSPVDVSLVDIDLSFWTDLFKKYTYLSSFFTLSTYVDVKINLHTYIKYTHKYKHTHAHIYI